MDIGKRVRTARKSAGLSQEALARQAEMSLRALNSLERGESSDPHYSTLVGIADALDMSIGELLGEPVLAGKAEAPKAGLSEDADEKAAREGVAAWAEIATDFVFRWEKERTERAEKRDFPEERYLEIQLAGIGISTALGEATDLYEKSLGLSKEAATHYHMVRGILLKTLEGVRQSYEGLSADREASQRRAAFRVIQEKISA